MIQREFSIALRDDPPIAGERERYAESIAPRPGPAPHSARTPRRARAAAHAARDARDARRTRRWRQNMCLRYATLEMRPSDSIVVSMLVPP